MSSPLFIKGHFAINFQFHAQKVLFKGPNSVIIFWPYLPKQDVRLHLTFGLRMNGTFIVRFYMANLLNLQQVTSNQLIRGLPSMHGFVPTIEWR